MFERFTDRARRVVVLAQQEARALGHERIGTGHLLLGLISGGDGGAVKALENLGVSLDEVRVLVVAEIGRHEEQNHARHIPLSRDARKALEMSLRVALRLGHTYVSTEHLLLGLLRQGTPSELQDGSVAVKVLTQAGVTYDATRQQVVQLINREKPPGPKVNGTSIAHVEDPSPTQPAPDTDPELVRRAINALLGATNAQLEEVLWLLDKE